MSKRILAAVPVYHAVDPEPFMCFLLASQHTGRVEAQGGPRVRWMTMGPKNPIQTARNQACGAAIHGKADFLAFADDDMLIQPADIFYRLAAHDVDIVSPLFFRSGDDNAPLLFNAGENGQAVSMKNYPKDSLVQVTYGVGTGCMVIKREVLERMEAPWFYDLPKKPGSSDLNFCKRAIELGFKVYCDTSIKVKQMGPAKPVGEEDFLAQLELDSNSVN